MNSKVRAYKMLWIAIVGGVFAELGLPTPELTNLARMLATVCIFGSIVWLLRVCFRKGE